MLLAVDEKDLYKASVRTGKQAKVLYTSIAVRHSAKLLSRQ